MHKRRSNQWNNFRRKDHRRKDYRNKAFFSFFAKEISAIPLTANFKTFQIIIRMTFFIRMLTIYKSDERRQWKLPCFRMQQIVYLSDSQWRNLHRRNIKRDLVSMIRSYDSWVSNSYLIEFISLIIESKQVMKIWWYWGAPASRIWWTYLLRDSSPV